MTVGDSFRNFSIVSRATELYFMYYLRVIIGLFGMRLYQSPSSSYSFRKLVFPPSVFTIFPVCSVF